MADDRWGGDMTLERESLAIPSSREGLLRRTYEAKQSLRAGEGLPKKLQGNQVDLVTHYAYSRALEEGGHDLSEKKAERLGTELSKRMDATIRVLEKEKSLEKMPFGFREKGSGDRFTNDSVVYSRTMSMFIIKDSSLASGTTQRRIFKDDEFYERYEPPEEWQ